MNAYTQRSDRPQLAIVTATAAEGIRTRTGVAYAPRCAFTSGSKLCVTQRLIRVKTRTRGRFARAQSGAIPYGGRYRGTRLRSPAIADAPANQRITMVARS